MIRGVLFITLGCLLTCTPYESLDIRNQRAYQISFADTSHILNTCQCEAKVIDTLVDVRSPLVSSITFPEDWLPVSLRPERLLTNPRVRVRVILYHDTLWRLMAE